MKKKLFAVLLTFVTSLMMSSPAFAFIGTADITNVSYTGSVASITINNFTPPLSDFTGGVVGSQCGFLYSTNYQFNEGDSQNFVQDDSGTCTLLDGTITLSRDMAGFMPPVASDGKGCYGAQIFDDAFVNIWQAGSFQDYPSETSKGFDYLGADCTIPAMSAAPSLDPVQSASIAAATGSISSTAASFILSSFIEVLPYILLLVGLYFCFRMIWKYMQYAQDDSRGVLGSDGNLGDHGVSFEEMEDADIWQSDFNDNGKINIKEYQQHWEDNIDNSWTESPSGIEQHMSDQGEATYYDGDTPVSEIK